MHRDSEAPRWRAIAAMAADRTVGDRGDLPWRLPGDLQWVKACTFGHAVVMGRRTWESLRGRTLPGREMIVLSRSLGPRPGLTVVRDIAALDAVVLPSGMVRWVFGGAEIYRLLLPRCEDLLLTEVATSPGGDTRMPPFEDAFEPAEVLRHEDGFRIVRWVRRGATSPDQGERNR